MSESRNRPKKVLSMASIICGTFLSMRQSAAVARLEKLEKMKETAHGFTNSGLPAPTKPRQIETNYYGKTSNYSAKTGKRASERYAKQIARGQLKTANGLSKV